MARINSSLAIKTDLVAIHEAAHAVMALTLGFEIGGISVVEDGNIIAAVSTAVPTWLAGCAVGEPPEDFPFTSDSRLLVFRYAMVALGGSIAEMIHDEQRADRWQIGGSADWTHAENLAEYFGFDLADVQASDRELLGEPDRWRQVQAVAARLTRGTFLHPDQVTRIMFQSGGI